MSGEMTVIDTRLPGRRCGGQRPDGSACRVYPRRDSAFCFWHDPASAEEAAEARRIGGLHRRREKVVATAYDLEPLDNVAGIRRLFEVAALDALAKENSPHRARTLIAVGLALTRLLEVEALLGHRERVGGIEGTPSANRMNQIEGSR